MYYYKDTPTEVKAFRKKIRLEKKSSSWDRQVEEENGRADRGLGSSGQGPGRVEMGLGSASPSPRLPAAAYDAATRPPLTSELQRRKQLG